MTTIDKIVFSQNAPAKNTLWARPSEKGTELLIFNRGKWSIVGADDFQRFHFEVYSSLEDITEPKPNALYLIGPKGEGEDKYDEYVYTEEGFTKIGDTSIDMSDVVKYNQYSDGSYTLKAKGTEIKKLRTTDDSTMILGNNNSIEFRASGTINMQSGKISGVKDIQMTYGKIDNLWDIYGGYNDTHIYMTGNNNINVGGATIDNVGTISGSSGGLDITASGTGVTINDVIISNGYSYSGKKERAIKNVDNITMYSGTLQGVKKISFDGLSTATLISGLGAWASGVAVWAENFGVSGDLVFSGGSSVQKKVQGTSGSLPVVTFEGTMDTGSRVHTDIMSLGKDKALSVIGYYNHDNPFQPYGSPEVRVSGTLNVSGVIYAGNTYNAISGNSGGMYIRTDPYISVDINGVKINSISGISEVATLSFKSGGTLNVSGGTINADGANIYGTISASGATINYAHINSGTFAGFTQIGAVNISGASNISGAGGAVNIKFSGAGISGKLDMISGILETSGVTLKSGGTLTFGDGTKMSTATNLDDADNVIGGKELKIYYGTGGASISPFSYTDYKTQLYIGRVSTDEVFCNSGIICSTISGTLRGTIESTTFNSGNTFTTGFIDELKTALGIS